MSGLAAKIREHEKKLRDVTTERAHEAMGGGVQGPTLELFKTGTGSKR